jgi:hypothetical protein
MAVAVVVEYVQQGNVWTDSAYRVKYLAHLDIAAQMAVEGNVRLVHRGSLV